MLWTDVIDPATLTGYARQSLAAYEAARGTLARWLPNRDVADTDVRFIAGSAGLVEEARYRAYDAEPEVGANKPLKRITLELPAISQKIPVTEYQQLRERNASDDAIRNAILRTTDTVVRAIADRTERTRGVVLNTGKATISQSNFVASDDFGRSSSHTITAGTLWSTSTADVLGDLETWRDLYVQDNGVEPGAIITSTRVVRAMAKTAGLATQLVNGASRPATVADVQATVELAGLPPIVLYDRRTSAGRVIADTQLILAPAPVAVDDWQGTDLGATFWGQTLTASDPKFADAGLDELPGLVVGTWRNDEPPMIAQVIGDSINLPVLANADLTIAVKVL